MGENGELRELHCAICDIYEVFDRWLADGDGYHHEAADLIAELVDILPPRGHQLHDLAVWQTMYRSVR